MWEIIRKPKLRRRPHLGKLNRFSTRKHYALGQMASL